MSHSDEKETVLKVHGLDCANCARTVETGVQQLAGIESCHLSFATEKMSVKGELSSQEIIKRVRELGFDASDVLSDSNAETPNFFSYMWQSFDSRLTLLGGIFILPGLILTEIGHFQHGLIDLASVTAMIIAGWPIARSAWRAVLINREININVLMTIAAIGAVIIGAYTEAGLVMVLFAMGEALEGYTTSRARDSIRSLMAVKPNQATRLREGEEEQVNISELQIGDRIVVKPGERIPMDGRVQAGGSWVNQAPITGESKLIDKAVGSEVFASSINGEGVLEIEVTCLAEDNTISRLIRMVEEAQDKQAPSQRFIDRFARYYTPAVVVLALVVMIVPPLFFGQPFWNPTPDSFGWLYRGLAVLVVACPCALVISTPVSIISAISNAAKQGVLIKGGVFLEALSGVKAIAFDKTGTLTAGEPSVVNVRSQACSDAQDSCSACHELLALATAVERRSEHPLGRAIVQEAERRGVKTKYSAAEMVRALTGQGIVGQVNGHKILIGSHSYFDANVPHSSGECQAAQADVESGHTPLMIAQEGKYMGTVTVADTVRESSQEMITQLKQAGLEHIVMLTGDHQGVAESIAQEVGVDDVRAELLPEHKVSAIQSLQQEYGPMAMVGDGINDAPALATAEVGIAIGGASSGSTQAMETADITLMQDDLRRLAFTFKLSRATMKTIYLNVIFSIALKLLFLILVLAGLGTMWMAVLADVGTSLLVTLNGMRLFHYTPKESHFDG